MDGPGIIVILEGDLDVIHIMTRNESVIPK